jgi:hypothetical protein
VSCQVHCFQLCGGFGHSRWFWLVQLDLVLYFTTGLLLHNQEVLHIDYVQVEEWMVGWCTCTSTNRLCQATAWKFTSTSNKQNGNEIDRQTLPCCYTHHLPSKPMSLVCTTTDTGSVHHDATVVAKTCMISLMGKSCIPKLHPCSTKRSAPRIANSAGHLSRHYNMHNKPTPRQPGTTTCNLSCWLVKALWPLYVQEECATKPCLGNCTAISSEGSTPGMQHVAVPVIM